jgi:thioredoxin 1
MALELTDITGQEIINSGEMVVIDFWAPWCGPCKMVGPIVEKLAENYSDTVKIGKLNIDDNNDLATAYGVRNIPTILFFKNGQVVDKQVGATQEAKLDEKIQNLINT